jgi:hypothetical protein
MSYLLCARELVQRFPKAANTMIEEAGTGKFKGNSIRIYVHEGMKVVVDETRKLIMSIRSVDSRQFKLDK